ncbi:ATP-binding protein, partial [Streptomyces sp. NPDC006539]
VPERPAARPERPEQGQPRRPTGSTLHGLPVRAPGRTMAEAEREREQRRSASEATSGTASETADGNGPEQRPARDAGARFGAFHRGRRSAGGTTGPDARPESEPPAAP